MNVNAIYKTVQEPIVKAELAINKKETLLIENVGRWCKCGCNREIPQKSYSNREFFSDSCRGKYYRKQQGFTLSRFAMRSTLKIRKTPKGKMTIEIYPRRGEKVTLVITKNMGELYQTCLSLEKRFKKQVMKS